MKQCPVCKNTRVYYTSWSEEGYHVEDVLRCYKCNEFEESWSYGSQYFKIGKWDIAFSSHNYLNSEQQLKADKHIKEYELRLRYYKRRKRK